MSHVVARCLGAARHENPDSLQACLRTWESACGQPFPDVTRRAVKARPLYAGGIQEYIAQLAR
jgi:hypothetical protein